jgi:hypothetical protein
VSFPTPNRADHQKFCERDGWTQVRTARGKTGTHHITFELILQDGRILRTRISHPPDRSTFGAALWGHIVRDQLDVTENVFWDCVHAKVVPTRAAAPKPGVGIPAAVVHQLIKHGVPESEFAEMTRAEALQRLNEFWLTGE